VISVGPKTKWCVQVMVENILWKLKHVDSSLLDLNPLIQKHYPPSKYQLQIAHKNSSSMGIPIAPKAISKLFAKPFLVSLT